MKRTTTLAALALCVLASAPCSADEGNAAAEELFAEGRKLMAAKDFAAACPKLEASQRLDPGAGTLLNLAGCYEGLGRTASAWAAYRAAEGAADRAGRADWRRAAEQHAEALAPALSRLTISVAADALTTGLVVERDGEPLDAALYGQALPVDPGLHLVAAHAPGRAPFSAKVTVAPRADNAKLTVPALPTVPADPAATATPAPASAPPPPATAPEGPPDDGSQRRSLGLVVGGVGLASIAVGTALGAIAKSTYDDALSNECRGRATTCTSGGVKDVGTAHTQATASTVFFAAGGAALVTGVILFFTAPRARGVRAFVAPGAHGSAFFLEGTY